jgi:hypothetical protein
MADIYSNLEQVNAAVQEAGAGDKRNRNNAIRRGLENPGLYQSAFQQSVQPTQTVQTEQPMQPTQLTQMGNVQTVPEAPWTAPSSWGQKEYDLQEGQWEGAVSRAPKLVNGSYYSSSGAEISPEYVPDTRESLGIGNRSLEDYHKETEDLGKMFRSKGFIPGASGNGWSYIPGYSDVGSGNGPDATREEGAGVWTKANPDAYKGMGMDWITYSPTSGYGTGQYLKQAPKQHGVGGFLSSPGGMMLMSFLGAGLGAGGLGELFGGASGAAGGAAGGLSSLEGALGAAGGMSVAPGIASSGLLGSIGSLSPAMSLVPGGAAMAGVASGALGSGGLLGKGGILGSGIDTGSKLVNSGIENFGKSLLSSGGDVKKSGINSLSGGLSAGLGGLFDSDISKYVSSMSKPLLSSALSGGSFQSGLQNALYGGASTGLGSLLNSTDLMSGNTQEKNALANNTIGLGRTLAKLKRK